MSDAEQWNEDDFNLTPCGKCGKPLGPPGQRFCDLHHEGPPEPSKELALLEQILAKLEEMAPPKEPNVYHEEYYW